ncbi:MAG TPA: lipocalin-like domain-containing protein [Gemmatimonadales bacterium]|nr:lipocalin-like domain-containing protein [Gemmatimonadales bacterium]
MPGCLLQKEAACASSRSGLYLAIIASISGATGTTFQTTPQIYGAWTLIQSSLASRDTTITNGSPQPGLLVFSKRHYSLMLVEGSAPRTPFAEPSRPTEAEKLAAYDTFVGHSGTYVVADSLIEMHVVVAKSPSLMGTDLRTSFARFVYRIQGDTLWLARYAANGVSRMRLLRAE